MPVQLSVTLRDSPDQMQRKILTAIRDHLNNILPSAVPNIKSRLQDLIDGLIHRTPEYISLISGGQLAVELGVPDAGSRLDAILSKIRDSVQVNFRRVTVRGNIDLGGGYQILALQKDFQDIISLSEAKYDSNGHEVPWLEWLILEGDNIIIANYDILYTDRGKSRSGQAIMIHKSGAGFRIPPSFSGTASNNFLTRALNVPGIEAEITKIVEQEVQRRF
jgi:hypothetical protein